MDWQRECVAVIPCYNEEVTIPSVILQTRRYIPSVLVVDDCSTDNTSAAAQRAGASVLRQPVRSGKGAALQAGWDWAVANRFSWALTLDGDGQHSPDDIPLFLAAAAQHQPGLVVGNRMTNPKGMPLLRRFVNWWMSRQLSKSLGQPLLDTQCGFRLMHLKALPRLTSTARHFEIESEVLLAFAAAGLPIRFVPIRVIYGQERSKINPVADTIRWLRWWRERRQVLN